MLVNESNVFKSGTDVKLRICLWNGADFVIEVDPDLAVEKLKTSILAHPSPGHASSSSHRHANETAAKDAVYYKVVDVRTGRQLKDDHTLKEEGIKENDELLLLEKRLSQITITPTKKKKESGSAGPTLDDIVLATKNESVRHVTDDSPKTVVGGDFLFELRRILISLIEAAHKILCLDEEAVKAIQKSLEHSSDAEEEPENTEESCSVYIDDVALDQLIDMGFKRQHATKALLLNKMSSVASIQWLLEHESDPDIDAPLPEMTPGGTVPQEVESGNKTSRSVSSDINEPTTVQECAVSFLAQYHERNKKRFKPNPRAVHNLMEMGFDHEHVLAALRATNNKEADACDLLLSGNRDAAPSDDADNGLDTNGSLYKSIMANPIVQLGISNPRNLQAFTQILENPNTTAQWLSDPDTGPMLLQISRIYHGEKNAGVSDSERDGAVGGETSAESNSGASSKT